MPRLNQKGPMGQGSMSGRKMGKCTNFGAKEKKETLEDNATLTETTPENISGKGLGNGNGMGQGKSLGIGRQHRFRNGQ